jgi:hypothetical protein
MSLWCTLIVCEFYTKMMQRYEGMNWPLCLPGSLTR